MKHKKVTLEVLRKGGACEEAIEEFQQNYKSIDSIELLEELMRKRKDAGKYLDWANWLIVRIMERKQYLAYAIYAAEQVLYIYEEKYPGDDRPRRAIEAAKKVLKKDTEKNRNAAHAAEYAAAGAANYTADYAAEYAAAGAACAACAANTADVAYYTANVAYTAYYATFAADADSKTKMQRKILRHGIKLLKKEV